MTHPMLVEAEKCTQVLDGARRIDGNHDDASCKREDGHRGLHRDSWAIHPDTLKWGDDVCRQAA
jgi:hypothetical protein